MNQMQASSSKSNVQENALSQGEYLTTVRFARYTAVTADKLSNMLLNLTTKLEQAGILDSKRSSRLDRDTKLKKMAIDVTKSNCEVSELIRRIPGHPQADEIIHALLADIRLPHPPVNPQNGDSNVPNGISGTGSDAPFPSHSIDSSGLPSIDDPIMSLVTSVTGAQEAIANMLESLPQSGTSGTSSGLPDLSTC